MEGTWKNFADALDGRTDVLSLSVDFHHRAEQYGDSVSSWAAACEANQPLPSDIQGLETAIRTHQSLYEAMCQKYTEVRQTRHVQYCLLFILHLHSEMYMVV